MSFRLLKRYADSYGKRVNLVSGDPRLQAMSLEAGFTAYPNLAAYDRGGEVHRPELAGEPTSTGATPIAPAASAVAPAAPPSSQPIAPQRRVATMDRPRATSVMSAPPKQQASAPRKAAPAGPPLGSYRPYLIGAAVLVVVVLLVGILYLPTATATVFVQGTPLKADVTLLGAPGVAAGSPDHFATQAIHAEESQNLPGTPTGQKQVAAVPSTGEVVITSKCVFCIGQDVRKGLIVLTDGGKRYATQAVAHIGIGYNAQATVPIAAVTGGLDGNTPEHTITNIENGDPDLRVDNPKATTGGADARTATVIQQSDIDSIKDVYAKDAVPQVTDQLNSKAQGQKLVLVGNGVQTTATSDHKVGEEVTGFTITIKVAGDGAAFDEKVVQQMLKGFLERKVPQ